MRAYLIVIALLLAIFGSIAGFLFQKYASYGNNDFSTAAVTIGATTARMELRQTELEAVGSIRAARGVELSTEERGEIIAIDFSSGNLVQAGDLLITLNDKVEQASRERQVANLKLARLLYDRDKRLVGQKSIPESQYDRSKADLESAIAQLAEIEARLENKRIHAPFSGTTGITQVKVGDYVEPGTPITTLQDLSELEVDFTLPARHYPELEIGQKIKLQVAAFPDKNFKAILQALDSQVDAGTRSILLRATIQNSEGLLPGMFARLVINLGKPEQIVALPDTAVTYSLHGNTIYVIEQTPDGLSATSRVVETGESRGGRVAILSGLDAGERVVSAGQNKLFRGAMVEIDESIRF
ncbi:MAG: efflux RND transporter periplasmic adaptor subunit [Halioglobus sp.]